MDKELSTLAKKQPRTGKASLVLAALGLLGAGGYGWRHRRQDRKGR